MITSSTPVMPPSEPSSRNPGLMVAVVISIVIAVGVGGYFAMKGAIPSMTSSEGTAAPAFSTVSLFGHVTTNTSRTGADEDSTLTYLQGHADETDYCVQFDRESDGVTVGQLSDSTVAININSVVGIEEGPIVVAALNKVMSIDGGLLTDLCSHDDDVYALVLSADLQTMTPYRLANGTDDVRMVAYNPVLTPGGYGAVYFDHVPGIVIVGTNMKHDDETVEWQYYALDRSSGATDLIESCDQDATVSPATVSCSREYTQ